MALKAPYHVGNLKLVTRNKGMQKFLKIFLPILLSTTLIACIEVEEDNDDVSAALDRQNQLIEQQNAAASPKITLFGSILNLADDAPIDGQVRVKVGNVQSDAVATVNGNFEISNISPNSNFELVVESSTGAFLTRAMYGISRDNSVGEAFQDVGVIGVSEGVTRSFSILDSDTSEPIPGLLLKGYSNISTGSGAEDYAHSSIYNAATATYDIILPEHIEVALYTNFDVDNDGVDDYARIAVTGSAFSSDNGFFFSSISVSITRLGTYGKLLLPSDETQEVSEILLKALIPVDYQDIQLRVSVIDTTAEVFPGLTLNIDDVINGEMTSTFDDVSDQYVFDAEIDSSLTIFIPSFEYDGTTYESASIDIRRTDDGTFIVSHNNSANYAYYDVPEDSSVYNFAIEPKPTVPTSLLEIVATSEELDSNYNFKVFYSHAVQLPEDSAKLFQSNTYSVVRGNESNTDLVPAGTTLIQSNDIEIGIVATLSLNDTLLTLAPNATLSEGGNFYFEVDTVIDQTSGIESVFYQDDFSFRTGVSGEFDIESMVLDNLSYTNNGLAIVPQNTAGITANSQDYDRRVYAYLPRTIENLETFSLTKRLVTEGSYVKTENSTIPVVNDGVIQTSPPVYTVQVAENENKDVNSYYVDFGTSLAEAYYHKVYIYERMSDHTAGETNTVVFDYIIERKTGEIENGSVTLQVQ